MIRVDVITIFPKIFEAVINESIIKRARAKKRVEIKIHNLRDYADNRHRKVDDRPFGGGPGMVLNPSPVFKAVKEIKKRSKIAKVILLTAQGQKLNQVKVEKMSKYKRLILLCPHYEGLDERVRVELVDEEISIGDYILTGGELPALVLIDAITRLQPGVLGDEESVKFESFSSGLLEYPHYTRPADFRGMKVPQILLSGNHKEIESWRRKQALKRTKERRPDLYKKYLKKSKK
jgi:tRNA (guanine37-N1)-methyltransferase